MQLTDKRIKVRGRQLVVPEEFLPTDPDERSEVVFSLETVNGLLRGVERNPADYGATDKQRIYVVTMRMEGLSCPACMSAVSPIMAATDFVASLLDASYSDREHACTRCGEGLTYVVPFVGNCRWVLTSALDRAAARQARDDADS